MSLIFGVERRDLNGDLGMCKQTWSSGISLHRPSCGHGAKSGHFFVVFSFFFTQFKYQMKKWRCCAWDSNPGPQDVRHRRVYRTMRSLGKNWKSEEYQTKNVAISEWHNSVCRSITSLFYGLGHCDQIWRNFATLAKSFKYWAIYLVLNYYLAKFEPTLAKFVYFWSNIHWGK